MSYHATAISISKGLICVKQINFSYLILYLFIEKFPTQQESKKRFQSLVHTNKLHGLVLNFTLFKHTSERHKKWKIQKKNHNFFVSSSTKLFALGKENYRRKKLVLSNRKHRTPSSQPHNQYLSKKKNETPNAQVLNNIFVLKYLKINLGFSTKNSNFSLFLLFHFLQSTSTLLNCLRFWYKSFIILPCLRSILKVHFQISFPCYTTPFSAL